MTILAYGAEWPTLTPSESDALDLATLLAMVLTALAHPWELIGDAAPRLAEALAHAWVWVDAKWTHVAWLASLAPPRAA
jgi:hypothetical protein